jgi:chaperonin GroES
MSEPINLTPLNKSVLVKPDAQATTTQSGIVIPQDSRHTSNSGMVLKVSEDVKDCFQTLVAKKILFKPYAGVSINDNKEEYLILSEDDIVAVMD